MKLLSKNAKLVKGDHYNVVGLSLAPANRSGYNVCPESTESCRNMCVLWFRGMTVTSTVRAAFIKRAKFFFEDRPNFLKQLHSELKTHEKRTNPIVRLNTASDLPFHKIDETLYDYDMQFYDYTKIRSKVQDYADGKLPKNLQVTYSWNEHSDPKQVADWLDQGLNVAMVMDVKYTNKEKGELPKFVTIEGKKRPVVDGDEIDVRLHEVDGFGVVVGLRAKIAAAKKQEFIDRGFIINDWNIS